MTDYSAHHFDRTQASDPAGAIAGAPADAQVKVLLAHQPRSAFAASKFGFDLQLSGHTHGGQFVPWNFFVRLSQPFTAGLARLGDLWVYTSRGTGCGARRSAWARRRRSRDFDSFRLDASRLFERRDSVCPIRKRCA